jgi:hypothetical protein
MGSPFTQDTIAPAKVSMDVTPRTGILGHANDMHDNLFYLIDESMTFGDTPKASERPDPLAPVNTSPVMKGRTVNFKTTSPFHYGDDKNGYPNFNTGTYSVAHTTAPVPVTNQEHSAYAPLLFLLYYASAEIPIHSLTPAMWHIHLL